MPCTFLPVLKIVKLASLLCSCADLACHACKACKDVSQEVDTPQVAVTGCGDQLFPSAAVLPDLPVRCETVPAATQANEGAQHGCRVLMMQPLEDIDMQPAASQGLQIVGL